MKAKERSYEENKAKREKKRKAGETVKGREPKPPDPDTPEKLPYNFTDPESRIMKSGKEYVRGVRPAMAPGRFKWLKSL